jgi:hypothetical protein
MMQLVLRLYSLIEGSSLEREVLFLFNQETYLGLETMKAYR